MKTSLTSSRRQTLSLSPKIIFKTQNVLEITYE